MEKQYIYRTNDLYEFNTLEEAKKHAELNESCTTITQYNIFSEDDYEEPKQVWVRESRLVEGTSNFGRLEYLPLLVFYLYEDIVDTLKYNPEYPRWDDFGTTSEYYDAVEEFEEKFLDNFEYPILYEDDFENLENDLELFNEETKSIAYDLDVDENGYQKYGSNLDLEDIELDTEPGYYEANYIDCKHEEYFDNLDEAVKKEQLERFTNFLNDLKSKYNLTQLGVTGTLSNGETIYHKVESLKEDEEKKDSIYYCLSDKKMPKHSILLYGEEGKDKLLEIAPKYLEYYGQAEIFKSVNGHKTTIWEDGKLVEEEPTIKIKPDSEKVIIDKEDTSEVGEPGNPVQQGLKGVSKLENLNEAHLDYSDNLGEFTFNGTNYWVKGEKSHTRDYHWQEVYIKDTDHIYETVGYGKYKWLNRPWYRFEYDPAFKQAFLRAFGTKYEKFITDIIDSSYSVKDCCEKITKSSENLEDGLEESKKNNLKEAFNGEEIFVHVFDIDYYVTEEDVDNESEIEEIKAKLPQDLYFSFEEYFEDDSELEERIADAISDETGWLVETFDYELLSEEEYNHYSQLKEAKKKKEKVRFVGNPEKEMAFFNHAMGSDVPVSSEVSVGASIGESKEFYGNARILKSKDELPKVGEPYGYKNYFVIKVNQKKDKNGKVIYDVVSQDKAARDRKLGNNVDVAHYSFIVEESLTESRDDERVAHYQELLDELYVTPKETELILKTADEYEKTAQKGWITYEAIDKITEKLGLKHLSQLDLSRMWEIVYYTLEKAAFENDGKNYEKYSDAASAFAEVINMEARRRKEHANSDANLEGIVGDRFAIDNDGLLYLYTSAMKDIIAWAKRRGKSIDELLDMSITKTKDGQAGTLRLKDYSIEFKRLWDQVREKLEIKENK